MKAMNCNTFRSCIPCALSGELDGDERRAFDTHLESCGACGREFSALKETYEFLDVPETGRNVVPTHSSHGPVKRMNRGYWMRAASILIVLSSLAVYTIIHRYNTTDESAETQNAVTVTVNETDSGNQPEAIQGEEPAAMEVASNDDDPYDGGSSSMLGVCVTNLNK